MSIDKNNQQIVIHKQTQVVVFYHKNCTDGFIAGFNWWIAHKDDNRIHQYIPFQYKETIGDLTGKEVVMLDVTVLPEQFQQIKRVAKSIFVLDHHKGALEDYGAAFTEGRYGFNKCRCSESTSEKSFLFPHEHKKPSQVVFSRNMQSGALMSFEHCKTIIRDEGWVDGYISLLEYISVRTSDRDLWIFQYPDTKAVYEVLQTFNYNFDKLHQCLLLGADHFSHLVAAAQIRVDMRSEFANLYASKAESIKFMGYEIPAVNCPANMSSEVGDSLNSKSDISFALLYVINHEKAFCSLRSSSKNSNSVDVSAIAKKFGGNGHLNSAGFSVSTDTLLEIIRSKH